MKINVKKLQLISTFKGMAFYLPIVSLFFLSQDVALSLIVISQVFYAVFFLIGNIPAGILADKVGHKQSIVLSGLVSGIGYILMVIIPSGFGLFIAYSLRGLGNSFVNGSDESLMYESVLESEGSSKSFKRHWSIYNSNGVIGFAFSTLIAGLVLSRYGESSYIPLIILTGVAEMVAFIIALSLKSPSKFAEEAKRKTFVIMNASVELIRSNKTVLTLLIVPILTFSGEYFLYSVYQPYFQNAGVKPIYIGMVLTIGALLNFFVLRNSHRIERYLPLEKILPLFSLILALAYALMSLFTSPIILVGSFISLKGLFNAQNPIIADYIHEHTESAIRSTVASSIAFIQQFFQIIARVTLGILVSIIGISGTLKLQAIYLFVGAIIAYFLMVACGCTHKINRHHFTD